MHWIELEGRHVPVRIGGHPGLDFCNTWAGWDDRTNPRGEWLRTYDDFAVWTLHAELVSTSDVRRLRRSAARDPGRATRVLFTAGKSRTNGTAKSAKSSAQIDDLWEKRPRGARWQSTRRLSF